MERRLKALCQPLTDMRTVALLWHLSKLHSVSNPSLKTPLWVHKKCTYQVYSHITVLRSTSPGDNIDILWIKFVYSPYSWRDLNVSVWWMMVITDGKGGGIVVDTTDLCTLNLNATLAHNGEHVCRYREMITLSYLNPKAYIWNVPCGYWRS